MERAGRYTDGRVNGHCVVSGGRVELTDSNYSFEPPIVVF